MIPKITISLLICVIIAYVVGARYPGFARTVKLA